MHGLANFKLIQYIFWGVGGFLLFKILYKSEQKCGKYWKNLTYAIKQSNDSTESMFSKL